MIKASLEFLGILLVSLMSFSFSGFDKKINDGSNVVILDKSIEKEIDSFVNYMYSDYNKLLQLNKGIIVEIYEENNEFFIRFLFGWPYKCSSQLKGIINYNYRDFKLYYFPRGDINKYQKFFVVNYKVLCSEYKNDNGVIMLINNEHRLNVNFTTLAVIEKKLCYDESSNQWFPID